jgi:hypothetical protein
VTFLWHAFVIVLVAVVVLALVGLASLAVARRLVLRRWHRVRQHVVTRGVFAAASSAMAWREQATAQQAPGMLATGTSTRVRRRLRQAVDAADDSVQRAEQSGAPVAELPAVCRSLRTVAGDVDAMLRLERRLPQHHAAVRSQAAEVIRAARDVQAAALEAMSDAADPRLRALVREASQEVEIVAAALQRLRSVT